MLQGDLIFIVDDGHGEIVHLEDHLTRILFTQVESHIATPLVYQCVAAYAGVLLTGCKELLLH
jgi:hypothetical protein